MEKDLFQPMVQQQIGGYAFENPLLLRQAFVRKSYTSENGGENNEVLEFIGDKVLDIAVVRYLTKLYGNDLHVTDSIPAAFRPVKRPEEFKCKLSEGELTKLKQRMVEKKALSMRIDDLGLARFLIVGKGDEKNNASQTDSVKEDLFEAIIGAVALDSNWNFEKLQDVVEIMLCPDMFIESGDAADYVSLIYEWESKRNGTIPWFKYPDYGYSASYYMSEPNTVYQSVRGGNLNNLKYTCELKLLDELPVFAGFGTSKHEARKAVCELAYNYLEDHDMLFDIHDEIDNPCLEESINQLEILARRGYFNIPEYTFKETHDENGNPIWHVECHIEGMKNFYSADGSSKKNTKKEAAFKMLSYILDLDE